MNDTQLLRILGYIWAAFGIYWLIASSKGKAAQTHEPPYYRLARLGVLGITFSLLFWKPSAAGILGRRFVFESRTVECIGFGLALAGFAIATWARVHLAQYWSDKIILKVDHQLIRSGPYAYVRHPIYSGVLLAVLGTALLLGEARGLLAFALMLVNYAIKAKREEGVLAEHFGYEFREHARRAGFLLPRLRPH
jgi:protein-S-isoprenylcysteine O-methyltransferase Ste14